MHIKITGRKEGSANRNKYGLVVDLSKGVSLIQKEIDGEMTVRVSGPGFDPFIVLEPKYEYVAPDQFIPLEIDEQ